MVCRRRFTIQAFFTFSGRSTGSGPDPSYVLVAQPILLKILILLKTTLFYMKSGYTITNLDEQHVAYE